MSARALVCLFVVLSFAPLSAWKNPRQSATLNTPIFGTHDWVAFKGYVLAGVAVENTVRVASIEVMDVLR